MKTTFPFDHYYKYDELKSNLEFFAEKYPDLCTLEVNCVTEKGRNQYVVTLTNKNTGEALSKPGWYLDGNIHAGEVTASMCAMHTIDYLLTNYETDPKAKYILDHLTVYVIPRVTPDGAEKYLSTPYTLRSADRAHNPEKGGVREEDLDDDGVIRMMRIPTPYGAWKKDGDSMALRDPSDRTGEFYDIYPEGYLEEFEGMENMKRKKPDWSLDFNRNFPYGWYPEGRQSGAGKYPLSNPECKALCDFVIAHPNICGAAIGHTSGGLILYPPGTRSPQKVSADDIASLKAIAEMGKEELDYVPMNIFDSFIHDQENYDSGAFDDWCYQAMGIPAYTMEFWNLAKLAGKPYEWGGKEEDPKEGIARFNACMKWVKENAPRYYSDWKEYDHPDFGKVEIGGFNYKFTQQNPPEELLAAECEKDTRFNMRFAQACPQLCIDTLKCEKVKEGVFRITAIVGNTGYLPTNLTDEAVKMNKNKPVKVCIDAEEILLGLKEETVGDLSGYSRTMTYSHYGNLSTAANAKARKKLQWIVAGREGDVVTVTAAQEKAGTAKAEITLA